MQNTVKPKLVETYMYGGYRRYYININIIEQENTFIYDQVEIPVGKFTYDGIVNELVVFKYPNDKMQAVINNYLLDQTDSYTLTEFNKM